MQLMSTPKSNYIFFEMLPPPAGDSELPLYGLLLFFHDNECYINILTEGCKMSPAGGGRMYDLKKKSRGGGWGVTSFVHPHL